MRARWSTKPNSRPSSSGWFSCLIRRQLCLKLIKLNENWTELAAYFTTYAIKGSNIPKTLLLWCAFLTEKGTRQILKQRVTHTSSKEECPYSRSRLFEPSRKIGIINYFLPKCSNWTNAAKFAFVKKWKQPWQGSTTAQQNVNVHNLQLSCMVRIKGKNSVTEISWLVVWLFQAKGKI